MMKPAASNLAISLPIALLLSSEMPKWLLDRLGSRSDVTLVLGKFLGTPGMSCGDHANMSRFSRRNSTSSLSYLLLSPAPTTTNLLGSEGSKAIFLLSLQFGTGSHHRLSWPSQSAKVLWPELGPW